MAAEDTFLFTSESVNEGHPDKLCDQVGFIERLGPGEGPAWPRGPLCGACERRLPPAAAPGPRFAVLGAAVGTGLLGKGFSRPCPPGGPRSRAPAKHCALRSSPSPRQVSDAILDACLEQDPLSKVRRQWGSSGAPRRRGERASDRQRAGARRSTLPRGACPLSRGPGGGGARPRLPACRGALAALPVTGHIGRPAAGSAPNSASWHA